MERVFYRVLLTTISKDTLDKKQKNEIKNTIKISKFILNCVKNICKLLPILYCFY
jgi:hypothetical protein